MVSPITLHLRSTIICPQHPLNPTHLVHVCTGRNSCHHLWRRCTGGKRGSSIRISLCGRQRVVCGTLYITTDKFNSRGQYQLMTTGNTPQQMLPTQYSLSLLERKTARLYFFLNPISLLLSLYNSRTPLMRLHLQGCTPRTCREMCASLR